VVWVVAVQNIEPQGLAGKILRNKELRADRFLGLIAKTIVLLWLEERGVLLICQNIESQGLAGKILRKNDLASAVRSWSLVVLMNIIPILFFPYSQ
jgi:hypothetical protein